MRIPLKLDQEEPQSRLSQTRIPESEILAAKGGDWNAKNALARAFMPLLQSRAEKRSSDVAVVNNYIEAGKKGLFKAARKYKKNVGPARFQIFALDFIEASMDRAEKGGGLLSRLFGGG